MSRETDYLAKFQIDCQETQVIIEELVVSYKFKLLKEPVTVAKALVEVNDFLNKIIIKLGFLDNAFQNSKSELPLLSIMEEKSELPRDEEFFAEGKNAVDEMGEL